jgi:nucleotide-binding universal stress UspA family protein
MIALKKILVATDFSELSDAALAYGRDLARSLGAHLVVLHVVDNARTPPGGAGHFLADPDRQTTLEAEGKRRLDELISDDDRTLLCAQGVVVTSNAPAFVIVEYATGSDVSLIVIGTHGRSDTTHPLLGSVAERVVRIAPCPVLTVRHPERAFELPDRSTQLRAVLSPPKDDALAAVTKAVRRTS